MTKIDFIYNTFINHKLVKLEICEPDVFMFYQKHPDKALPVYDLLETDDLKSFMEYMIDNFDKKDCELLYKEMLKYYELILCI